MKPLSEFCCINTGCSEHGNGVVRTYGFIRSPRTRGQAYGKSDTIRLLECKVCRRKFSERTHTALSGSRPRVRGEKIMAISGIM